METGAIAPDEGSVALKQNISGRAKLHHNPRGDTRHNLKHTTKSFRMPASKDRNRNRQRGCTRLALRYVKAAAEVLFEYGKPIVPCIEASLSDMVKASDLIRLAPEMPENVKALLFVPQYALAVGWVLTEQLLIPPQTAGEI